MRILLAILWIVCLGPFVVMAYRLMRDPQWRKVGPDLTNTPNMTVPPDFHG